MIHGFKALTAVAILTGICAAPAGAEDLDSMTFAQFTQQSSAKIAHYEATGTGNTLTIAESPVYFAVTTFGPNGIYPSTMTMTAASVSPISNVGLQDQQTGWAGNIHFGDGANYLDVSFSNATFSFDGTGGSASLISTDPANPISYTSSFLTFPTFDFKNFSLSFTGLTPPFQVAANGFGQAFNANIAGSFAGSAVPEPANWALLVSGFGLVGMAARCRLRPVAVTA
jgi:hypothetical protein